MTHDDRRTMAFGRVNAFIVTVHPKESPSDADWDKYIEFCLGSGLAHGTITRYLVITHGGAPSSKQQRMMHEQVGEPLRRNPQALKGAIVSSSTFVRGIVNAMNLVQPVYRAFSPADIARAYEYVGISPAYVGEIERMIASLEAQLGLRPEPPP
jgi:hypothetical protein